MKENSKIFLENSKILIWIAVFSAIFAFFMTAKCTDNITNNTEIIRVDTVFKCENRCETDTLICDHRGHCDH